MRHIAIMTTTLYLLQFGCLIFTVVMALTLTLARIYIAHDHRPYETSRWLLVSATSLLSVHYLLQMVFDIRANGDDIGAMVNILFYTPVAFLISYAVLNLECGREMLRMHLKVGLVGCGLIFALCCASCFVNGGFHIGASLYIIDALFLICMLYFIFIPTREIRRIYMSVESNTGGDMKSYLLYVKTGFSLLCISALTIPFTIISTNALYVAAPLMLPLLLSFVINFIALGYNASMIQTIEENCDERVSEVASKAFKRELLPPERVVHIKSMLDRWVTTDGYLKTELTLSSLSQSLGVNRRELSVYFECHEHTTFRVWLSNIRFLAAKRMLVEHPEYSNDAISAACGFSSRAQLYNIFRDKVGMTPKEYLTRHLNGL